VKVQVLTVKKKSINSYGLVYPLIKNRSLLKERGIEIENICVADSQLRGSDVLILDSKYLKNKWALDSNGAFETLKQIASTSNRLYWFDTGDSSGLIQAQVIPLVHKYIKGQVLKDRAEYSRSLYGGRSFTDSLFRQGLVRDSAPIYSQVLNIADLGKLKVGWNYGLAGGYGLPGNTMLRWVARGIRQSYHPRKNRYSEVRLARERAIFLRMNLRYHRETIAYQRKATVHLLRRYQSDIQKVSKKAYLKELKCSKVAVSPFGWGEINIRDFETFVSGSLLVKPSMSHIETFPDYFSENETYVATTWDLSNLEAQIDEVLNNFDEYQDIAIEGQERFRLFSEHPVGQRRFVDHVEQLLE
jgi:hypothetical protein